MSKETNDAWANAHYGHDAHPIVDNKCPLFIQGTHPHLVDSWREFDGATITEVYAAPVAVAAVDVAILRALADRWATDRSYTGSPVDDIRALIEKPTMSTPAAPGIDLVSLIALRDKLYSSKPHGQGDYERGRVAGLQHAADCLRTMIDASPKGQ